MQNQANIVISINNLTVLYNKKPVIENLNVQFPSENMCSIIGPNGSGKTTLLKSIVGIIQPSTGSIQIYNQHGKKNLKIAYVPQKNSIDWTFPINVFDVVMMGRYHTLAWWQKPKKEDHEIVFWALQQVEMIDFGHRQISQLSGGQQQRIFLARALAQQADIFVLDEPFTGIDIKTENFLLNLFNNLKNQNKTILIVHHDLNTVLQYFDWTLMMHQNYTTFGPTKKIITPENIKKLFYPAQGLFHDFL